MFVPRENNSKVVEWQDEIYRDGKYTIVERRSGDFEVYYYRKLIARTESYEAAIEYIRTVKESA